MSSAADPGSWEARVNRWFAPRAALYAKRSDGALWGAVRRLEWEAVREALEPRPSDRILEIGAGAGFYAGKLKGLCAEYLACEPCPEMARALKAAGVACVEGPVDAVAADARFDKILLAGVLEFCERPEETLARANSLLAPGGRVVALYPRGGPAGLLYRLAHRGCPLTDSRAIARALDARFGAGLEVRSAGPLALCARAKA